MLQAYYKTSAVGRTYSHPSWPVLPAPTSTNTERKDSVLFLNILSKGEAWYVFVKDGCHPTSPLLYFYQWYRLWKSDKFWVQIPGLYLSTVWFGENHLTSLNLTVCICKTGMVILVPKRMSGMIYTKHKPSKMLAILLLLLLLTFLYSSFTHYSTSTIQHLICAGCQKQ